MRASQLMGASQKPPAAQSQPFAARQFLFETSSDRINNLDKATRASTATVSRPPFGQNLAEGLQNLGNQFSNLGKQLGNRLGMVAPPQQMQEAPQVFLGGKWRKDKQVCDGSRSAA